MYCTNCGHRNQQGANFCSTCGTTLRPEKTDGETTVTFLLETEGEGEEEFQVPLEELEDGRAIVVIRRGPEAGTRFALEGDSITIGRDPESTIFLDDVTVSRKHAEFQSDPKSGYSITDTGSLNGTFVNRDRVEQIALSNGDEIQIGKFKLVFFSGGPPQS